MTEKKWDDFAELLTAIMDMEGTWQEKKEELLHQMKQRDAEAALSEVTGWFND